MISRTTIVFARPFDLPGFDEQLPAGDYDIETELSAPPDHRDPARWKASVMLSLHPRSSHPGLSRNLTVSLADLDGALARDKLTGKDLATFLLDALLTDPMVQLVMKADGVSETQLRHLYARSGNPPEADPFGDGDDDPPEAAPLRRRLPCVSPGGPEPRRRTGDEPNAFGTLSMRRTKAA